MLFSLKETHATQTVHPDVMKELTNLYRLIEDNWNNPSSSGDKKFSGFKSVSVYAVESVTNPDELLLKSSSKCLRENLCDSKFFVTMKPSEW